MTSAFARTARRDRLTATVFDPIAVLGDAVALEDWSPRASASAGVELLHSEIIVLGNSAAWSGDNVIAHGVMRDAIDLPSLIGVLGALEITISGQLDEAEASCILAVLAKAEASRSGTIRGNL